MPTPTPTPTTALTPFTGPAVAFRLMADWNRTTLEVWPASMLVATSPFLMAPPLWILALMVGGGGSCNK